MRILAVETSTLAGGAALLHGDRLGGGYFLNIKAPPPPRPRQKKGGGLPQPLSLVGRRDESRLGVSGGGPRSAVRPAQGAGHFRRGRCGDSRRAAPSAAWGQRALRAGRPAPAVAGLRGGPRPRAPPRGADGGRFRVDAALPPALRSRAQAPPCPPGLLSR